MQSREKVIDLKGWTIVKEGSEFRFYNKNVKFCHRDKFPWLIGEFKITLDINHGNRATINVNKMVPGAFPLIYFADRDHLDKLKKDKDYEEKYHNESEGMFFTSPFSRHYAEDGLYKIGCNQYSDSIFTSCAELGLYAHAQCNDDASYAAFIKDGLSILALVDSSLYEAISVMQTEINKISMQITNEMNNRNKKFHHTSSQDTETITLLSNEDAVVKAEVIYPPGTLLLRACEDNDAILLQQMLDEGTDANVMDENRITGLYVASQNGWIDIVNILLKHHADPNIKIAHGLPTPLFTACANNRNEIVSALIEAGANVNELNKKGYTPLMIAATVDNTTATEHLLVAGAQLEVNGQLELEGKVVSPILLAESNGNSDLAKMLILHEGIQETKKQNPELNYVVRFNKATNQFTIFQIQRSNERENRQSSQENQLKMGCDYIRHE